MRAVRLDEIGPPENLKVVDVPVPEPGDDDVLIKVEYAGLIYGDAEARRGTYFTETKVPWFPGRDVAGTVEKCGKNVTGFKKGQRVMALLLHGTGCAEYTLAWTKPKTINGKFIPNGDLLPIPDNVTSTQALVYLINFRLAYFVFHVSAKTPQGSRVMIHGAAGGMGTMITQLARKHGCEIIAGHRTAEEADYCKANGADHLINVTKQDYVEEVLKITGGKGVACSFNGVGGDTIHTDWKIMQPFGEIMFYGYAAGKQALKVFDIARTVSMKTFSADDFLKVPAYADAAKDAMFDMFKTGPLLDVSTVLPLEEAATAHRMLDEGRVIGKIALKL